MPGARAGAQVHEELEFSAEKRRHFYPADAAFPPIQYQVLRPGGWMHKGLLQPTNSIRRLLTFVHTLLLRPGREDLGSLSASRTALARSSTPRRELHL